MKIQEYDKRYPLWYIEAESVVEQMTRAADMFLYDYDLVGYRDERGDFLIPWYECEQILAQYRRWA